jgi:hypothetical protein
MSENVIIKPIKMYWKVSSDIVSVLVSISILCDIQTKRKSYFSESIAIVRQCVTVQCIRPVLVPGVQRQGQHGLLFQEVLRAGRTERWRHRVAVPCGTAVGACAQHIWECRGKLGAQRGHDGEGNSWTCLGSQRTSMSELLPRRMWKSKETRPTVSGYRWCSKDCHLPRASSHGYDPNLQLLHIHLVCHWQTIGSSFHWDKHSKRG